MIVAFDIDGVLAVSVQKIYDAANEMCFEGYYMEAQPNPNIDREFQ